MAGLVKRDLRPFAGRPPPTMLRVSERPCAVPFQSDQSALQRRRRRMPAEMCAANWCRWLCHP
jgi:hypothetical protein